MITGLGLSTRSEPIRAAIEAARAAAATVPAADRTLAIVVASGAPARGGAELAAAVAEVTGAPHIIGASAPGLGIGAQEVEGDAVAVVLIGGTPAKVSLAGGLQHDSGAAISAVLGDLRPGEQGTALLWFDAMTVGPAPMVDAMRQQASETLAIIGLGAVDRGGAPWVLAGEQPARDAVVGLWLPEVSARWVQAPVGRPLSKPMTITRGMGGVIGELDGRRAYEVLVETIKAPMASDLDRLGRTVFIGLPGPGGAELVRPLLGVDPYSGALAIGGSTVQEGQAVRFILRSPDQARENLQAAIAELAEGLDQPPDLLLAVRAAGRGAELYGPDLGGIEAALVASAFPGVPTLNVMSACELTPTGDGHALHLYTTLLVALNTTRH